MMICIEDPYAESRLSAVTASGMRRQAALRFAHAANIAGEAFSPLIKRPASGILIQLITTTHGVSWAIGAGVLHLKHVAADTPKEVTAARTAGRRTVIIGNIHVFPALG